MRTAIILVAFLALARVSSAQGSIVSYQQQIFAPGVSPGTGTPQWTNTYLSSAFVCGQAPIAAPASGDVVNPGHIEFDDPTTPGKSCIASFVGSWLSALPNGVGYMMTLTATDNMGQVSARSAASNPFDRQGPPPALTGLKVIP